MQQIDLNCDAGEGMDSENAIIPFVSSISIACGGHTGDEESMRKTVQLAKKAGVAIGAHPSYPDRENFGRVTMNIDEATLKNSIKTQIETLHSIANQEQYPLTHIKPHGALYNDAAKNNKLADIIANTLIEINAAFLLWGPPKSALAEASARRGIRFVAEGFADRTYQPDGSLTPRSQMNALISNPSECIKQVLQLVKEKKVTATNGSSIDWPVQTICIHGDGPHALLFAEHIHAALKESGILIKPTYASI